MSKSSRIILNGEIIKEENAKISPLSRAMMYGDGCFETMRYYSGSFLGWDRHFQRLSNGLEYLSIYPAFSADELRQQVLRLIEVNQLSDDELMVRIQCWREGKRGFKTDAKTMGWMVTVSKIEIDSTPLTLTVANTRCIPSVALSRTHKLSNGLNYIKAAQEASQRNCDNALMLTINKHISETTSANIFWVNEDMIYTPSQDCDLLPGITRALMLEVIKEEGMQIKTGEFKLEEIKKAEAVFCTNSLIELKEVRSIDDVHYQMNHPIVEKLKTGFEQLKAREWTNESV